MGYVQFSALPLSSRLWVFAADREIAGAEKEMLMREMQGFVNSWTAHQASLEASCDLKYDRFLLISVNENMAGASGCSIDEMMRRIRTLGETYGVEFLGMPRVQYRTQGGGIRSVSREEFAKLAQVKEVSSHTTVFDNSITSLGDLATGKWELPAGSSWHARAFELSS
jgi:hypothetical protein